MSDEPTVRCVSAERFVLASLGGSCKVPMGVYGMTASIAAHQTLLARAGAEEDPRLLYEALRAYPIGADTKSAHEMWRKLLISSKDFIAPAFQSMPDYYEI